jgi:tetratricopeptide (TPR) repeat protein
VTPSYDLKSQSRLDSWKSIALYFGRTCRTVQRWHCENGLPVHRAGGIKSSVFAYVDELEGWMRNRGSVVTDESAGSSKPVPARTPLGKEASTSPSQKLNSSLIPEQAKARSRDLVDLSCKMWESLSHGNLQAIVRFLREACDQDPTNATAFGCLSLALIAEGLWGDVRPEAAYLSAGAAVRRAFEMDSEEIEAKCADAWLKTISTRDWEGARRGFDAILNHRSMGTRALNGRALLHIVEGCLEEASSLLLEAAERNPLSSSPMALYCWNQYLAGEYANALDQVEQIRAGGRPCPITEAVEAMAFIQIEEPEVHIDRLEAMVAASPRNDIVRGVLGYTYGTTGQDRKARKVLDAITDSGSRAMRCEPYAIALILIGLNERPMAVEWLEKSFRNGSLWSLGFQSDPILEALSNDPHYLLFLGRASYPTSMSASSHLASAS